MKASAAERTLTALRTGAVIHAYPSHIRVVAPDQSYTVIAHATFVVLKTAGRIRMTSTDAVPTHHSRVAEWRLV